VNKHNELKTTEAVGCKYVKNTMRPKEKDRRQYNDQKKKTEDRRQYNDQKKKTEDRKQYND
jgi:hypothetical protein